MFIIVNNQPVILTVWTSPEHGTSVHSQKSILNDMMNALGGGYQLEEIDLSGFEPLPIQE